MTIAFVGRAMVALAVLLVAPQQPARPAPASCVVGIDIGHSDSRPGSTSARGVAEHVFNSAMGKALMEALNARGDIRGFTIDPDTAGGLPARAETASQRAADVLVSLHHDSVQPQYLSTWKYQGKELRYSDRFQGHSLFVSQKNPQSVASLALATRIGERVLALGRRPTLHHAEAIPGENRQLLNARLGIYRFDDLILLKTTTVPAVLLEAGVIVNRDEERRLATTAYRTRLAGAVADGIRDFCKSRPKASR